MFQYGGLVIASAVVEGVVSGAEGKEVGGGHQAADIRRVVGDHDPPGLVEDPQAVDGRLTADLVEGVPGLFVAAVGHVGHDAVADRFGNEPGMLGSHLLQHELLVPQVVPGGPDNGQHQDKSSQPEEF